MSESPPYLTLKLAHELFGKAPGRLEPEERQRVEAVLARQLKIERRILATPEAAQVMLPAASLDQAVAQIRGRYASHGEFLADLQQLDLDLVQLAAALARDLTVDAVLERVASQVAEVSETELEIFYLVHRERFHRPEYRRLHHILVTINDALPGSERSTARHTIDAIHARLVKSPERFAELALQHSECPTAMNGGLLGNVKRDQLYAELEAVAFALAPGELSAVVESPLGFHILHCVAVEGAGDLPLASVRAKIRKHITETRRRARQKAWIAGLFGTEVGRCISRNGG